MKNILLSIIIISTIVSAKDISNFDIKGVKLGMTLSQVKILKLCNNPEIKRSKNLKESTYICNDLNYKVFLNNNKVTSIYFNKYIGNTDQELLLEKVKLKYGRPSSKLDITCETERSYGFCWNCETRTINGDIANCHGIKAKFHELKARAIFIITTNSDNKNYYPRLTFELEDNSYELKKINLDF